MQMFLLFMNFSQIFITPPVRHKITQQSLTEGFRR